MLNENIRNLRKAKGLSQEELAIKLNVVRQTVSKWEKSLSVPDSSMLVLLAEELDTSVSTQITWFVITEFIIILFGDIPPLSMIEGAFLKYFGIPVALTWFMSQKTFDGKKPYSFLKSQITYALRPKITYAGKAVKLHKQILNETITAVRSVNYVPDKIY